MPQPVETLYLLTPTGGRPEGLQLLAEYIAGQDYAGPVLWVIVDDCDPSSELKAAPVEVRYLRPHWRWTPGHNTQAKSILYGLNMVRPTAKLLILEDDEVYLPGYFKTMADALDEVELVGERVARYYNVRTNRHRTLGSKGHAALAATGVRGTHHLRRACMVAPKSIDMHLWRNEKCSRRLLETDYVIGIKGLPGRPGIGVGHRENFGQTDRGDTLREWAGEAAANYQEFRP